MFHYLYWTTTIQVPLKLFEVTAPYYIACHVVNNLLHYHKVVKRILNNTATFSFHYYLTDYLSKGPQPMDWLSQANNSILVSALTRGSLNLGLGSLFSFETPFINSSLQVPCTWAYSSTASAPLIRQWLWVQNRGGKFHHVINTAVFLRELAVLQRGLKGGGDGGLNPVSGRFKPHQSQFQIPPVRDKL